MKQLGVAPGGRLFRATTYAVTGWSAEVAFSALHDLARRQPLRLRTSAWMLPIYALIQPFYEPLHDGMRKRVPAPVRAAVYAVGFMTVEYGTGRVLRALLGEAPWDYSYAPRHIDGLVRPDYFPLWAIAGVALEYLHDRLAPSEAAPNMKE